MRPCRSHDTDENSTSKNMVSLCLFFSSERPQGVHQREASGAQQIAWSASGEWSRSSAHRQRGESPHLALERLAFLALVAILICGERKSVRGLLWWVLLLPCSRSTLRTNGSIKSIAKPLVGGSRAERLELFYPCTQSRRPCCCSR